METRKTSAFRKIILYLLGAIIIGTGVFVYYRYYFVFGEGVKTGQLNYVVKKGYVFKTYEGKLIQSGFYASGTTGVQSYEFEFSVDNETIAKKLMLAGGREVELYYREYKGSLPWRGYSKYIVDSIVSIHSQDIPKELYTKPQPKSTISDSIK